MKARRWTLAVFAAIGLSLIGLAWPVRHNNFALTVLLNLGTAALVVVAVSLVALYLDGRIETTSQELRGFIRAWRQAEGALPRSTTPIKDAAEEAAHKMDKEQNERFNRLQQRPRADRLADLLFEGRQHRWLGSRVSVPLDEEFRLEFSTDDKGHTTWVQIKVVGRSQHSRNAVWGRPGFQLYWSRKVKFSKEIVLIAENLRQIAYSGDAAIRNSDQVWQRLVQTLRITFGFNEQKATAPLSEVIEIPNAHWAIVDSRGPGERIIGGIENISSRRTFYVSDIWNDHLVAEESEAGEQGASFAEAVKVAREIFWHH